MRRALRGLTAPFRQFFNDHFNMVKGEITSTREQVLGAGGDLARNQEIVAVSAEKVRDAVTFVGLRLGRLEDGQAALAAALDRLEAGHPTGGVAHTVWTALVAHHLAAEGPAGDVVVSGVSDALLEALRTLGYSPVHQAATPPLAVVVVGAPGPVLAASTVPAGTLVLALGAGATADPALAVSRSVPVGADVATVARRA